MSLRRRGPFLCLGVWLTSFGPPGAGAQFPDLVVQNITLTPANPTAGQVVAVEVELRNPGDSLPLQPFYLLLFEDVTEPTTIECGREDQRLLIEDTIPAGGASGRFYTFEVTYAAAGSRVLVAFVDGCQAVPEWNENNNTAAAEFFVAAPLPDLRIDSITTGTPSPLPNVAFDVTVVARNVGAAPAGAFRLAVVTDSATQPDEQAGCDAPLFEYIVGPVPPNVPVSRTFSVTYPAAGEYRLWAIADACGGAVQESDETNNARSADIPVRACADEDEDGICDEVDDCDDRVEARDWYRDADADGYGNSADAVRTCTRPDGFVDNATDCDDADPSVNPAAVPRCETGVDRNCNGVPDEQEPPPVWQADLDGDGFTDPNTRVQECQPPPGFRSPSATPDPADDDFQVPEPVTAEPLFIEVPVGVRGRSAPQTLRLRRSGPEDFTFAVDRDSIPMWLELFPNNGTSTAGVAEVAVTVIHAFAPRAPETANLSVTINGTGALQIPITVQSRWPRFTVRHAGQGGGYVVAEWNEDPNISFGEYTQTLLVDTTQGIYEGSIEVPPGRSVFLRMYTEGNCSTLEGLYDELGVRLNDPNWTYFESGPNDPGAEFPPCSGCYTYPAFVRVEGDRELTAEYTLSGLACTACGLILLTVSTVGLVARRRS